MNVARLNFSHGSHEYHSEVISNIKSVCSETRRVCAILLDTKGPEIRTIKLKDGKDVELKKGTTFTITTDESFVGDETKVMQRKRTRKQILNDFRQARVPFLTTTHAHYLSPSMDSSCVLRLSHPGVIQISSIFLKNVLFF